MNQDEYISSFKSIRNNIEVNKFQNLKNDLFSFLQFQILFLMMKSTFFF